MDIKLGNKHTMLSLLTISSVLQINGVEFPFDQDRFDPQSDYQILVAPVTKSSYSSYQTPVLRLPNPNTPVTKSHIF